MNYKQSNEILEKIEKSDKILISCHRNPDPDSIGSALALRKVLKDMGKKVEVVCSTNLDGSVSYLKGFDDIKKIDQDDFSYSNFDIFLVLDSSDWDQIIGGGKNKPKIPIIVIDHHVTNTNFGEINLVDIDASSVGEVLYKVFEDWGKEVDKEIAIDLLTSIIGDTGAFRYSAATNETLKIAEKLMKKGANKDKIIFNIYQNYELKLFKFFGEVIKEIKMDEDFGFVWSAIPYEVFEKSGKPKQAKEIASSSFMQSVKGTRFGFLILEREKGNSSISFRSRGKFDVSKIALELGGGGHKEAAGCSVSGSFDEVEEKVLEVVRKYAKENSK